MELSSAFWILSHATSALAEVSTYERGGDRRGRGREKRDRGRGGRNGRKGRTKEVGGGGGERRVGGGGGGGRDRWREATVVQYWI